MADNLTKMTADVNVISKLDNYPPDDVGMTPDKLKSLFDKGSNTIKDFINDTLIEEINPFLERETLRDSAEGDRVSAENARADAEEEREIAEGDEDSGRVKAELDRVAAEAARVLAEGDALSGRVKAEADRVTAELARVNAEGDTTKGRVKAENLRVAAEAARVIAEGDALSGRVKAENERVTAEQARVDAEGDATKGRVKAENARVVRDIARAVWEDYNPDKTYNTGNKVAYQGSSYYCVENLTKGIIPIGNPTRWALIASKGSGVTSTALWAESADATENTTWDNVAYGAPMLSTSIVNNALFDGNNNVAIVLHFVQHTGNALLVFDHSDGSTWYGHYVYNEIMYGFMLSSNGVTLLGEKGADGKKATRFVIGTSTTGWTASECDYLCDGTADQTEINAAITALPATGGEIVILDGTYNIAAKIDVTKNNVSIRGNGNATILKRMFNSASAEGVITVSGRDGCKIADLRVDGNGAIYNASYNYGIYLYDSYNNAVIGITCNNNITGIDLSSSYDNIVTGSICNNNTAAGINLNSSGNSAITRNTCNNNGPGIYLRSSSNNNAVTGNTCNDNSHGVYLDSSSNNTVTGNACNNNGPGINLRSSSNNNAVTGNTCNNNSSGVDLDDSSSNIVTGNTCNDNSSGIYVYFSSNSTVTCNSCIRGTGQASDYTASQHTIKLSGAGNNYNLVAMNNCMGKSVTTEGGTGNTLVNNKFDAT